MEHVVDLGSTPEAKKENTHDVPIAFQPPQCSIAVDKPKRSIQAPKRLITEADIVAHALNMTEEIKGIAKLFTYSEAISSSVSERWMTTMNDGIKSLEKNDT